MLCLPTFGPRGKFSFEDSYALTRGAQNKKRKEGKGEGERKRGGRGGGKRGEVEREIIGNRWMEIDVDLHERKFLRNHQSAILPVECYLLN